MESLSWFHQRKSPVVFLPRARPWIHHSGQEDGVRELARGCGYCDSKSHQHAKGGMRKRSESKRSLANRCKGYTMGRSRSCLTVQVMAVRIRGQETCPRSYTQSKQEDRIPTKAVRPALLTTMLQGNKDDLVSDFSAISAFRRKWSNR